MLKEYNVTQDITILYYKNMRNINISKNLVHHSRTKHIDIRHNFIREFVEDKVITLDHVSLEKQLVDIFTKALDATQCEKNKFLRVVLDGLFVSINVEVVEE